MSPDEQTATQPDPNIYKVNITLEGYEGTTAEVSYYTTRKTLQANPLTAAVLQALDVATEEAQPK